jgi:preprotein translocase subunit SecE
MKKIKAKPKAVLKEAGASGTRGQVVKLKPKSKRSFKLPPVLTYWHIVKEFVVEAAQELRKVTWPNRRETLGTTGVVLVLVILVAIFLGLVDFLLSHIVRYVVH